MIPTAPETAETVGTLRALQRGWCVVGRGENVGQLEARVLAGEWLAPGLIAKLLGAGRTTVHRWLDAGQTTTGLQLRHRVTASGYRVCHPDDVKAILASIREVH